ncbi:MAG: ATP-binding protein [Bacteroidota bacterium]|nr:ATP-binding protein [Bacteroidota bacterium]
MAPQIIANTLKGLDVIRERSRGLVSFVESYRKFTHLPKPEKISFPMLPFLEKIRILVSSEPDFETTQFRIEVQPEEMHLIADEKLISQVVINLVRNALQSLDARSNARIVLKACFDENGHPVVEVIDNGPGIPIELQEQIFIPFFTTRENGTGIGLSLSKQIMRLHGGSLRVNSRPGFTCFRMEF